MTDPHQVSIGGRQISLVDGLLAHVRGLCFITEYAGPNRGEGVEYCQKATGNEPPASWCASFVTRGAIDFLTPLGFTWPLVHSGRVETIRQDAIKQGALVTDRARLRKGMLFMAVADLGGGRLHAHHVGWVDEVAADGFVTSEGNAAKPGSPPSDNGTGAYWGRVRGNVRDALFAGVKYKPDFRLYQWIDWEKLL